MKKTCIDCGRAFTPRTDRHRRCDRHQPAHERATRSPSSYSWRDPVYRSNRALVLAGSPSCHWCQAPGADQVDHLVPVSRGGGHEVANLVAACGSCNASRNSNPDWSGPPAGGWR